jgi:hypothetical protein
LQQSHAFELGWTHRKALRRCRLFRRFSHDGLFVGARNQTFFSGGAFGALRGGDGRGENYADADNNRVESGAGNDDVFGWDGSNLIQGDNAVWLPAGDDYLRGQAEAKRDLAGLGRLPSEMVAQPTPSSFC